MRKNLALSEKLNQVIKNFINLIDGRPSAIKDQLKLKKIIHGAAYNKIKDKIITKQSPKKK